MPYTPLTREQFDKARSAGFSTDQIIQFEQRRKSEALAADAQQLQQPKENVFKKAGKGIFNFFTGSEQGLAKDISAGFGQQQYTPEQAAQIGQTTGKLIEEAHKLPMGDPRRTQLLQQAAQTAGIGQGQAEQNQKNIPSNFQTAMDIGGTAADILTAGTFNKAAKGMEAGKLFRKAVPSAVTAVEELGKKTAQKTGEILDKKSSAKTLEMVSPKLTTKESASAIAKRGTQKTGLFGRISSIADPYYKKVAETVQKFVPKFNPSKTISENINAVRESAYSMASDLKKQVIASGKDKLFSFRELGSRLNSIEKSPLLVGDAEKSYQKVVDKMIEIARNSGGKVSDLLDARKKFDQYISDYIGNKIYDQGKVTALGDAIKAVRSEVNQYIAERLPDTAFKESLTLQSHLFSAIDNMSEKAAKEVGTTNIGRFLAKHPTAVKIAKTLGVGAVVDKAIKQTTGFGF